MWLFSTEILITSIGAFLQINLMKPILARDRAGSSFITFIFKKFNWLKVAVVTVIQLFAAW